MTNLPRPELWTDRSWADLQRVIAARPEWVKPAHHPEMFGVGNRDAAFAGYLLDRGCLPTAPQPGDSTVSVPWEGRELRATFGLHRELIEEVGRFADSPRTWRTLALMESAGHRREVVALDGEVVVSVALPFRPHDREDLLKRLQMMTAEYRSALKDADEQGYADMVSVLVDAGLSVPYLPKGLRSALRSRAAWFWSTREQTDERRLEHYLLETADELESAVRDHATISHGGHGINSYALTWRMAVGPLAFMVQDGWGGAYGGPRDSGRLTELFGRFAALVDAAETRMQHTQHPPDGEWLRPVVVICSPMRGVLRCEVWDHVRGERVSLKLDPDSPWEQLERAIEDCFIPQVPPRPGFGESRRDR